MFVTETVENFAAKIYQLLKSDRDVTLGVAGFTGEGKTTFCNAIGKAYSKVSTSEWNFNRMTWSRKELMTWIDGEGATKAGQLPEYSVVCPDELFLMFYRRNWFDDSQIDAIATFNMCRDRHLFVIGNVPDFWDLDGAFVKRVRFYVYIPARGVAWVFQQENNPFSFDPWNVGENKKAFRKRKNPYDIPNFLFEVHFPDMLPDEKKEYLSIRKVKRVKAISENASARSESYGNVKRQRDNLIKWIWSSLFLQKEDKKFIKPTQRGICEVGDVSQELVSTVINGQR